MARGRNINDFSERWIKTGAKRSSRLLI
jgi:hypothetical protein